MITVHVLLNHRLCRFVVIVEASDNGRPAPLKANTTVTIHIEVSPATHVVSG